MKRWKMCAADFYRLLGTEQNYTCALTGRELTPQNTHIVHKIPIPLGGQHCRLNICLVAAPLEHLARRVPLQEIHSLCEEILSHRIRPKKRIRRQFEKDSKSAWVIMLSRISTVNRRTKQAASISTPPRTWGKTSEREIDRINKIARIKSPKSNQAKKEK